MKLTFLGAAGEVTGSQHLVETKHRRLLLDCGLFQGPRRQSRLKNEHFYCDPNNLDSVILSHAHIDHCGNLPRLMRFGFSGEVYCTEATADVLELMLKDSAHLQEEDAHYLRKVLHPGHPSTEPLYDNSDVQQLRKRIRTFPYDRWESLGNDVRIRFLDAGHILGSAIVELDLLDDGQWKRLVFTGDLGRHNTPVLRDPSNIERCDLLICESTYGGRVHPPANDMKAELLRIFNEAIVTQGKVIIPAFSLGRTQNLVYFLNELFNDGSLPRLPIVIDSPLATRVTEVYRDHYNIMDSETQEILEKDPDPFGFKDLTYTASQKESIDLNHRKGPIAIISASGMCEGGRVVHHIKHAVHSIENAIVLIGYQAPGTLGRQLAERHPYIKIHDRQFELKAHIEHLEGLSAHADQQDFYQWFEAASQQGGIGRCFLVHGEPESAQALAKSVKDFVDEEIVIPQFKQSFEV